MLAGFDEVKKLGATELDICTDSQLLARQLQGRYKVNAANLRPLFHRAKDVMGSFASVDIKHVPREENHEADHMANVALDSQADVFESLES